MNAYLLPVSCPNCSGELDHVAGSAGSLSESRAVCKCSRCSREWLLSVHVRPAPVPESIRRRKYRSVP